MKHISFLFLSLILSAGLLAQNLVINPSFENYSSCPNGPSEFESANNWTHPFNNVIGDTCSTSDLYNSCSFLGQFGVGVPDNIMGSEPAHTGNGYAGIILYEGFALTGCTPIFGSNWREYAQGELSSPLQAGQEYCVSFWVSLADNVKWATDDIGVHFSNSQLSVNCTSVSNSVLQVTPQLEYTGPDLDNANGWTELSWSYTAAGGEQFITIGNYKNDANTSYSCANAGAFNPYSYYYIDDVSVEPGACSVSCNLTVDIQTTQQDCLEGGTANLTANATGGSGNYSYTWTPSGTGQTLSNQGDGSYTVLVSDNSNAACSATESVTIDILDPVVADAGINDTICKGTTGELTASGGGTYLWDTGGTNATLIVGPGVTTTYEVTVTGSNGCTDTDEVTMVVYEVPSVSVETQDMQLCDNASSVAISVLPPGGTFSGPGLTGNSFSPSSAGIGVHTIYYEFGEYADCLGIDSVTFTVDLCTDIEQIFDPQFIHIYPVPSNGHFIVEFGPIGNLRGRIELLDVLGKLVTNPIEKNLDGLKQPFNVSNLNAGVYFIRVSTKNETFNRKILIE